MPWTRGPRLPLLNSGRATPALLDTLTGSNGASLAAHPLDTGGSWTIYVGAGEIQSNKLQSVTSGTALIAGANAQQANRAAGLDVTVAAASPYVAGVGFRLDSSGYGEFLILESKDGTTDYLTHYRRSLR